MHNRAASQCNNGVKTAVLKQFSEAQDGFQACVLPNVIVNPKGHTGTPQSINDPGDCCLLSQNLCGDQQGPFSSHGGQFKRYVGQGLSARIYFNRA